MGSVNHATGRKIPFFQWIHVMQLFCLVSKLQRMAEIFASWKMCKLPRCYSERQKPFLPLKFRDQKHFEQLFVSLLNLLYDTTDVFWRGMCWWEMLCWLAGARPGFSVARKQRKLWWVLWASVFWTSHQLSTMLLGAGGDLYLLLRIRELCQICLFFNSQPCLNECFFLWSKPSSPPFVG